MLNNSIAVLELCTTWLQHTRSWSLFLIVFVLAQSLQSSSHSWHWGRCWWASSPGARHSPNEYTSTPVKSDTESTASIQIHQDIRFLGISTSPENEQHQPRTFLSILPMDGNNTSVYAPFPDIQVYTYLTYVTSRELKIVESSLYSRHVPPSSNVLWHSGLHSPRKFHQVILNLRLLYWNLS